MNLMLVSYRCQRELGQPWISRLSMNSLNVLTKSYQMTSEDLEFTALVVWLTFIILFFVILKLQVPQPKCSQLLFKNSPFGEYWMNKGIQIWNGRLIITELLHSHPCAGSCETGTRPQGIPPVVLHQILQTLKHLTLLQIETSILILMDLNVFHFPVTVYHWQNDTERKDADRWGAPIRYFPAWIG